MSSPFEEGRDSNIAPGNGFGAEADVADDHVSAFEAFGRAVPADRLGEADYRG
jgi:hypothetical protein